MKTSDTPKELLAPTIPNAPVGTDVAPWSCAIEYTATCDNDEHRAQVLNWLHDSNGVLLVRDLHCAANPQLVSAIFPDHDMVALPDGMRRVRLTPALAHAINNRQ